MYGSTEHPSITGCYHTDPEHQRLDTDGRPLEGVEIRLVDDDGHPVPRRSAGRDLVTGTRLLHGLHRPGAHRRPVR